MTHGRRAGPTGSSGGRRGVRRARARSDRPAVRHRLSDPARPSRCRGCRAAGLVDRLDRPAGVARPGPPDAWLYRLLVRCCYRAAGRRRRHGTVVPLSPDVDLTGSASAAVGLEVRETVDVRLPPSAPSTVRSSSCITISACRATRSRPCWVSPTARSGPGCTTRCSACGQPSRRMSEPPTPIDRRASDDPSTGRRRTPAGLDPIRAGDGVPRIRGADPPSGTAYAPASIVAGRARSLDVPTGRCSRGPSSRRCRGGRARGHRRDARARLTRPA